MKTDASCASFQYGYNHRIQLITAQLYFVSERQYWAQINENENWTEGKLETQKYAKTVSLFSALSVITSKPAKTWRVYHSDTKKKNKKKNNSMECYINPLYRHQSGAPLYHSKVRRCGCWLKILRQRPSPDLFHTWKSHDDN